MRALVTVALLLTPTASVVAQTVSGGSLVETYSFRGSDDLRLESVRLLTLPFAGQVTLGPAVLGVSGAYADGSMTLATGESSSVAGLTDTRAFADVLVRGFLISASASIGTGDVVSTADEAILVGVLSTDLLPFEVHQWGTGGGFSADVAYALRLGAATLGIGLGASTTAETTPLSSGLVYRPGRQLRGRASLQAPVSAAGVVSIALGLQRFDTDTYDDRNLYRSGGRWEAVGSYAFAIGPRESMIALVAIDDIESGASEVRSYHLDYQGFTPAVVDRPRRTLFRAGMEMRLERGWAVFIPRTQWRALRREDGVGQGWVGSVGGSAEVTLRRSGYRRTLVAEPTMDVSLGSLAATESIESDIFGWRAGIVLRWSPAP